MREGEVMIIGGRRSGKMAELRLRVREAVVHVFASKGIDCIVSPELDIRTPAAEVETAAQVLRDTFSGLALKVRAYTKLDELAIKRSLNG